MSKELTVQTNKISSILSRAGDINALTFKTIDDKALAEINEWMPVVNQKTNAFQKQNSQTTLSLMTLNMVDSGPYRILRQILAQVEKKRSALKENLYEIEKKKIQYLELEAKENRSLLEDLEMKKISCDVVDSQQHIEAALKELGALKRRYEEICKNNNIPDNWDEQDFEQDEIKHHITSIFRNAIRDRMSGTHNHGTCEYMEQFGINPASAYALVDRYLNTIVNQIKDEKIPSIESQYDFYEKMHDIFKDEYKKAAKRIGLDSIIQADFLMKNHD